MNARNIGRGMAAGVLALACGRAAAQDDFQWSFEREGGPAGAVRAAPADAPAAARPAPGVAPGIGADAYDELLRENLELRRRIDETRAGKEDARRENERLAREIADFEGRIRELVGHIDAMRKERSAAVQDPEKVVDLESRLLSVETEKRELNEQLAVLKARLEAREAEGAPLRPASGDVPQGSALFRDLQRENAELKARLRNIEAESARAQALETKEQELRRELDKVGTAEREQRRSLDESLDQVKRLRAEVDRLKQEIEQKSGALDAREQDVRALRVELEKREHRLNRAERVASMLEQTREDVRMVRDVEKRDMHYNMAVVYAKEGRAADAEREYLRALRIDPVDADVHYNLAILYEDELKNPRKALVHYKRYLRLRPNASDAEQVRGWILRLETSGNL